MLGLSKFILGMQEQFNVWKSINVLYHINRVNNKHDYLDAGKAFDKTKTLNRLGIEGNFPEPTKDT